ncbi:hypothetical protein RCL1_004626 [Eukaryota sp. TZLM3-RCL]
MSKIQVIYGSETGNAQEFAEEIADHFKVEAIEGDEMNVSDLPEVENLIVVCSTGGAGELPANIEKFYQDLGDLKPDLSNVNLAVFGLGSSVYDDFNVGCKLVQKRLIELGAKPLDFSVSNLGDDEDADGYRTKAEPWFAQLKSKI